MLQVLETFLWYIADALVLYGYFNHSHDEDDVNDFRVVETARLLRNVFTRSSNDIATNRMSTELQSRTLVSRARNLIHTQWILT